MRHTIIILAVALLMAACSTESPVDKMAGSYNCTCTAYTQYQKDGKWRDTTYREKNAQVVIAKVDKSNLSVSFTSRRWGEAHFDRVGVKDWDFLANLSGSGTMTMNSTHFDYQTNLSGSYNYERKALALSASVQGVSPRLVLSLTNTE